MLPSPLRLASRASAGARASSAASVSEVWAVLAHSQRWGEFDPFVRSVASVEGSSDEAAGDAGTDLAADVRAGQHLRARLRLLPLGVPIEVDHVLDRSSVAVTARLLPGLAEEVEHLVIPSASGGSLLTVRLTLHGPLAVPALLPRWFVRVVTVRLLARAAEAGLRERKADVQSVA